MGKNVQKTAGGSAGRKRVILGLTCLVLAFVGVVVVLYVLVKDLRSKQDQLTMLAAQVEAVTQQNESLAEQNQELAQGVGSVIDVARVIEQAEQHYGPEVKEEHEGYLWIDRKADNWVVTLGVLNGVQTGNKLGVYDGDQRVGQVEVAMPLDVISYVLPTKVLKEQFNQDYFRVVLE